MTKLELNSGDVTPAGYGRLVLAVCADLTCSGRLGWGVGIGIGIGTGMDGHGWRAWIWIWGVYGLFGPGARLLAEGIRNGGI